MDATLIQDVVSEVMKRLGDKRPACGVRAANTHRFAWRLCKVDDAVIAADEAQKRLVNLPMEDRDAIVKLIKSIAKANAREWGAMELAETKVGRLDHKIEKLQILELVPGVEYLKTAATSGSNGLCIEEFAPFGVIGVVTPVTHSVPTLSANAINMIASGNSLVANAHPSGANSAAHAIREYNKQISAKYGIDNLITCVIPPTLESAEELFNHRGIALLVITGGPGVARAAMKARKRSIIAGPGNPPVVVDETACLQNAASSIVKGAAYDNNLLCIGEKQVFCVDSVFDKLMEQMTMAGGFILNAAQIESLTKAAFKPDKEGHLHVNKEFVGKDAAVLARAAGVSVPPMTQLLVGETNFEHLFVQEEQMMPFVPFVRVKNVDEAMDKAIESEHGISPYGADPQPQSRHDHAFWPQGEHDVVCRQRAEHGRAWAWVAKGISVTASRRRPARGSPRR